MMKQLWLALGMGIAVFAGVAVALAGPGAGWAQAAPDQLSVAGIASGLTVALLVLFAMVFLGLAAIDAIGTSQARRRLETLLARAHVGRAVEPHDLVAAMGEGILAESARAYVGTLREGAGGDGTYAGADPGEFFAPEALVDERLYLVAFRRLAAVLIVLSALVLAYGIQTLLADYGQVPAATLAANAQAVLVGCAVPLFGAIAVGGVIPIVVVLRRHQLAALMSRIRLLFPGATEELYTLRREVRQGGVADLRGSLSGAVGEVGRLFEAWRQRLEDRPIRRSGGGALQRSLNDGLTELTNAITRLSADQDKAVAQLVDQALTRFNAGFGGALTGQIESLRGILDGTERAVAGLGRSLEETARAAHDSGARLEATSSGIERKLEQVVDVLGQTAAALSAAAERRIEAIDGPGVAALAERLDRLDERLTMQVEEARGAATSLKQLHTGVDSLCLSVSPVLNRLVDTQDDLQAALAGENSTSRVLADLAEDLRQLSRANRETVDRHVQLAGELVKVGQVLETLAGNVQTRQPPAPKVSDGLMRALRELKQDTDEAARELPSLDHVA